MYVLAHLTEEYINISFKVQLRAALEILGVQQAEIQTHTATT